MKGHNNPGSGFGKEAGAARKTHRVRKVVARAQSVLVALSLLATLGVSSPLIATAEELPEPADTQTQSADSAADNTADATTTGTQADSSAVADGEQTDDAAQAAPSADPSASVDADSEVANGDGEATDSSDAAPATADSSDAAEGADSEDAEAADSEEAKAKAKAASKEAAAKNAEAAAAADGSMYPNLQYKSFKRWLQDSPASRFVDEDGTVYNYTTLGMILSNYNVFTPGDFRGTHVVGPVAVGGFATGFGQFQGEQNAQDYQAFLACMSKLRENGKNGVTDVKLCLADPETEGYEHNYSETNLALGNGGVWNVPSFVNGPLVETTEERWPDQLGGISGITYSNKDVVPFYAGEQNLTDPFLQLKYKAGSDSYEIFGNGKILFDDSWVNINSVMDEIKTESAQLADENDVEVYVEQCNENGNTLCLRSSDTSKVLVDSNIWNMRIMIKPGFKVKLRVDSNFEAYRKLLKDNNRPFNVQIVKDANTNVADLETTVINYITSDGVTDARLPGVIFVDNFDLNNNQMVQGIGTAENGEGIPIIFNYPTYAGEIDFDPDGVRSGTQYGHVVAPNADINMFCTSGNFNGTYIAKNIAINGEGHMWPYKGRMLSKTPGAVTVHANKEFLYGKLKGDDFTFTLTLTGATLSTPQEVKNDEDGNVDFDLEYDEANWEKGAVTDDENKRTFTYEMAEKSVTACGTEVGKVTCDGSKFEVIVTVKKTEEQGSLGPVTKYTVASVTYKRIANNQGESVTDGTTLNEAPTFTNVRNRNLETKARFGFDKYVDNAKLESTSEDTTFEFALRPARTIGTKEQHQSNTPMPSTGCVKTIQLDTPLYGTDGEPVMEGEGDAAKQVMVKEAACVVNNAAPVTYDKITRNIWFPEITYTKTGGYDYIVSEIEGSDEEMSYDLTERSISVTVSENSATGDLVSVVSMFDQSQINFRNYKKVHADLHFEKYLDGNPISDATDRSFQFDLFKAVKNEAAGEISKESDTPVCTVRNLGSAVNFTADRCGLTYDSSGHYYYIAVERTGTDSSLYYDEQDGAKIEHYIDVYVAEEDGKLQKPTVTYTSTAIDCPADNSGTKAKSGELCSSEVAKRFGNNHKPVPFEIRKNVTMLNGTPDPNAEFTFKVTFYKPNTNDQQLFPENTSVPYVLFTTTMTKGDHGETVTRTEQEDQTVSAADDGSLTVSFKANQTVRFNDLPYETVFEIYEEDLPFGYTFKSMADNNGHSDVVPKHNPNNWDELLKDENGNIVYYPHVNGIPLHEWPKVAYKDVVIVTATNEYATYRLPVAGGSGTNIRLLAAGIALLCAGMFICMQYARKAD